MCRHDLVLVVGSSFWQHGEDRFERARLEAGSMCRAVLWRAGFPPWKVSSPKISPHQATPTAALLSFPPSPQCLLHHCSTTVSHLLIPPSLLVMSPLHPAHTPWLPAGLLLKALPTEEPTGNCAARVPTSLISGKTVITEWALGWPELPPNHQYMSQKWFHSWQHLFSSWQACFVVFFFFFFWIWVWRMKSCCLGKLTWLAPFPAK